MEKLKETKARHNYKCHYCGRTIAKGERHLSDTSLGYCEGSGQVNRYCHRCKPIIIEESNLNLLHYEHI